MRYGVVIHARDEEASIRQVLESLYSQTISPTKVVLCNDMSKDRTGDIAMNCGAVVVDFPYDHPNWVSDPNLARTVNMALQEFDDDRLDYIMISGGDSIFPADYVESLYRNMKNDDVCVGSGQSEGEHTFAVRGSGRLVSYPWWRSKGLRYPVLHGFESWLLLVAEHDNRKTRLYPQIKFTQTRPSGTNYTVKVWMNRGRAMRAMGATKRFVFGRAAVLLLKKHSAKSMVYFLKGYMDKEVVRYDPQLISHNKQIQNEDLSMKNIPSLFQRFIHS